MRVLLLDFDGVLNSVSSMIYCNRLNMQGLTDTPSHQFFDPIACSNLQYILEELADVKVVITSTWRKYRTIDELKLIFDQNNLPSDRIVGVTPESEDRYRGKEIAAYLSTDFEVTDIVILDDDTDMDPYKDRLVKTDSRNGLTFTDAEKVIEMFGGTNEKI